MNTEQTSNKRERIGWYFYDWANSAYPLVINTAIFPIYYGAITTNNNSTLVQLFGITFQNEALYSFAIALAYGLVSIITPLLSGVADYSGKKKMFLQIFCTLGSLSCAGLFFFTRDNLPFGLLCVILSTIGFSGSLVFYNAFLPEIAPVEEQDAVSARGFAMGYAGSSILLITCLLLVMKPALFGINTTGLTDGGIFMMLAPYTFVLVAMWWQGFAQITFNRLRSGTARQVKGSLFSSGFRELQYVWQELQHQPQLKIFLGAFFVYSMGVQTVILMSTLFGKQEIHLADGQLIVTVLILQFIAIAGSYLFSWLSGKVGNIRALLIALVVWIVVCLSAYVITDAYSYYALAALVGLVLGGIQSLSRSTYSKLLPATQDHASYFSFYDICEKVGIVIGMFSYGWIANITGSTRNSIVALITFFITGFVILFQLRKHSGSNK